MVKKTPGEHLREQMAGGRCAADLRSTLAKTLMPRTNYIFVDFENIQDLDLDRIANKPVRVILVLGERNRNLPVALVKMLLKEPLI